MSNLVRSQEQQQVKLNHLKTLAKIAYESKQYQNQSELSLLNLMLTANDLGISPLKAINGGFYIVNGKVCMSTSLMADKIRREGHSIKILAMTNQKCVIAATRKDNGDTLSLEYTMEDAQVAGLVNSPTWKKFPKIMLYNRCMSSVARILFSDVIGNAYSEEERFDIQNVPAEKRPLELQEGDITVESAQVMDSVEIVDPGLNEEQFARLDAAIIDCGDVEHVEKLTKHIGVETIYEIKTKDFDRVMKSLTKKIAEKKVKAAEESNA